METSSLMLVRAKPSIPMIEERSPPFFRYGDSLVLKGVLSEPPVFEEFDWRERLAREGVHYLMFRPDVELTDGGGGVRALGWVYRVREEMAASLGRSLPEPRASLAQALLLGIRGGLPSELREDLAKTGTTHLIAISGLHVGILVGLVSLGSAHSWQEKTDLHRHTPAFRMGIRRAHRLLAAGCPGGHYGEPLPVGNIPGPTAKRVDCTLCGCGANGHD